MSHVPDYSPESVAPLSRRRFLKGAALAGAGVLASSSWLTTSLSALAARPGRGAATAKAKASKPAASLAALYPLTEKSFDHLKDQVEGLSPAQLEQHLGLYRNYVAQVAQLDARLDAMRQSGQWDAMRDVLLKQGYALNGALLHDLYFSALGGSQRAPGPLAAERIARDFGDFKAFESALRAAGGTMRGWVVVGLRAGDGKLGLYGQDAHDVGAPVGVTPILALDVYEHAYMIDYGTRRPAYLDVFWRNIDWAVVESRLKAALALG